MGLFKKYSLVDPLGAVFVLSDSNTTFISVLTGSDANPGTRALPKATLTGLNKIYNLVKGQYLDNVFTERMLFGDDIGTSIKNFMGGSGYNSAIVDITCENVGTGGQDRHWMLRSVIKGTATGIAGGRYGAMNCFINISNISVYGGYDSQYYFKNNTILSLNNYVCTQNYTQQKITNCIIVDSIDLYNYVSLNVAYYPTFYNCLFRKATVWKWNGVTITINWGSYGNEASDWLADLISAMTAYGVAMVTGAAKTYFQAMFPAIGSANILYGCKVVNDGYQGTPVFNRYDSNYIPLDYTLKLDSNNVAITMSDTMSYVGCYQASAKTNDLDNNVLEFTNPVNVDSNGNDTTGTPKLLVSPGAGKFQIGVEATEQTRNRCTSSNVVKFERGFTLVGFQSQMKSGLGSRFSFGKCQLYNTTTTPCLPMESLEVIPYDTIDHASSEVGYSQFPRFSAMFNDRCQMWFKTANNQPLLFSDLAAFGITVTQEISLTPAFLSEYGSWAVTNADMASYHLSTKTGCALRNIPLYFAKIQLNLNYYN